MRIKGKKRKIDENSSDSNRVVRARDDVQVSDFQSIVSDLKNEISRGSYNKEPVLAPKPGKKRSRTTNRGLHCRTCDNKFPSLDSLQRHQILKTSNTGKQTIFARN